MDRPPSILLLHVQAMHGRGGPQGPDAPLTLDVGMASLLLAMPLAPLLGLAGLPAPAKPASRDHILEFVQLSVESLARARGVWTDPWGDTVPGWSESAGRVVVMVAMESPMVIADGVPGERALAAQMLPLTSLLPCFRAIELHGAMPAGEALLELDALCRADPGLAAMVERLDLDACSRSKRLASSGRIPSL